MHVIALIASVFRFLVLYDLAFRRLVNVSDAAVTSMQTLSNVVSDDGYYSDF